MDMARILLVEDDAHTIRVMSLWLGRNRHTVTEAGNGCEALEVLRNNPTDLVISDINMPEMNGVELVRAIRLELLLSMPILIFSSRCDHAEIADDLKDLNVKLYPKPFVPSRLCAQIEHLLDPAQV